MQFPHDCLKETIVLITMLCQYNNEKQVCRNSTSNAGIILAEQSRWWWQLHVQSCIAGNVQYLSKSCIPSNVNGYGTYWKPPFLWNFFATHCAELFRAAPVSEYDKLLLDALEVGAYAKLNHMYASSSVLECPIQSYMPPSPAVSIANPYTSVICGHEVRKIGVEKFTLTWRMTTVPSIAANFKVNHFCYLQEWHSNAEEISSDSCETDHGKAEIDHKCAITNVGIILWGESESQISLTAVTSAMVPVIRIHCKVTQQLVVQMAKLLSPTLSQIEETQQWRLRLPVLWIQCR